MYCKGEIAVMALKWGRWKPPALRSQPGRPAPIGAPFLYASIIVFHWTLARLCRVQ